MTLPSFRSQSIKQVYPAVKFPVFMTVVYREIHVLKKYIFTSGYSIISFYYIKTIWANTNDVDLLICESTKNRNRVGTVGVFNIRAINVLSCRIFVLHKRRPAFSSCGDAAAAFVWPKGKHIKLIIFYLKKWNIHYFLERRKRSRDGYIIKYYPTLLRYPFGYLIMLWLNINVALLLYTSPAVSIL